jgi:hypothetical protein
MSIDHEMRDALTIVSCTRQVHSLAPNAGGAINGGVGEMRVGAGVEWETVNK